jgi:hypothetical protein
MPHPNLRDCIRIGFVIFRKLLKPETGFRHVFNERMITQILFENGKIIS